MERRRTKAQKKLGGKFLVGVVVGSGFVARAAETGGADFLLALPAGRMRNMGTASIACMLPIADADALTQDFAEREVLSMATLPVLLGTSSHGGAPEPEDLLARGFAGAVNFPSAMHYGAGLQDALERAGIGFTSEVERLARVQAAGGIAMLYCGTRAQAEQGARLGIDHIVYNFGWNAGGMGSGAGHHARTSLHEAAHIAHEVSRAVKRIRPDTRVLLEGGPIVDADDLGLVMRAATIDGYVGGSTIERMPLERSVADRIAAYRMAQHLPHRADAARDRTLRFGARAGFRGTSEALVRFLERLRLLAAGTDDLFLETQDGAEAEPAVRALCDAMGVARQTSRVWEALPSHAPPDVPARAALVIARDPQRLSSALQTELMHRENRTLWIARSLDVGLEAVDGLVPEVARHMEARRIALPALRDRADDLAALWDGACDRRLGPRGARPDLTPSAKLALRGHDWPGGEAELARVVAHLVQPGRSRIEGADVEAALALGEDADLDAATLDPRTQIVQALWRNGYRKGRTAAALGISRKTLYNRMRRLGLNG